MSVNLYGIVHSTCTQRVLLTAAEHGKSDSVKLIPVDLSKGEHKQAAHLARQPFGKIPALEDAGFVLYESRAIAKYLDEKYGVTLLPSVGDAKQRALVEQWLSLEATTFSPELTTIVANRIWKPQFFKQPTDEEAVAKAKDNLSTPFQVLNKQLEGRHYIAGNQFTFADLFFIPYINLLATTPEKSLIESHPNVNEWWKRIKDRPSYKYVYETLQKQ